MIESQFQAKLIKELSEIFEGCVVIKNDSCYIQGFPDLLILYKDKWAALECKRCKSARQQANQEYYIDTLDEMSFASFICPANKEEVLDELQHTFASRRPTRVSKCK